MTEGYIFVYSHRFNSFPVRLRIVKEGETVGSSELSQLTGTINRSEKDRFVTELKQRYKTADYDVRIMFASCWQEVKNNYPGLPDNEYPPPDRRIITGHPTALETKPELFNFVTKASLSIKIYYFIGALFCFAATMAIWPEFSQKFGSIVTWFYTLIYNPIYGGSIYGLVFLLFPLAGIVCCWKFIFYLRAQIRLDNQGILFEPGKRYATWQEIKYIIYANRRLAHLPRRISIQLHLHEGRPIDISHRFNKQLKLISLILGQIEPILLTRALRELESQQQVTFGKYLAITREKLILVKENKVLPLKDIDQIVVRGGIIKIIDSGGKLFFSCQVELIPDVIIIPQLFIRIGA